MNERSQNFGFGLAWLIGTITLVGLIPHTKIGPYISRMFFGKIPTITEWIIYLSVNMIVLLGLWFVMYVFHRGMRDNTLVMYVFHRGMRDNTPAEEDTNANTSQIYTILLGIVVIIILIGPRLIHKSMSDIEWYIRLGLGVLIIAYLLKQRLFDDQVNHRVLFDKVSIALAWSAVTAISATLFLGICSTGQNGTLRDFIYGLTRNRFESNVLYFFIAIGLLYALLVIGNRSIRALLGKELRLYFTTPVAYAAIMLFTFLTGLTFNNLYSIFDRYQSVYQTRQQNINFNLNDFVFIHTLQTFGIFLLFLIPILTMRLVAEEKKNRTYELLMTAPITTTEIILAKYMSVFTVLFVMLGITFIYPVIFGIISPGAFEWAPIFSGYLGLLLLAGTFAAIGLFCSTLSEEQIIAAAITFGILMTMFWLLGWAASLMPAGYLRDLIQYLAIREHMIEFTKGVVVSKDIIYYVSVIFFSIFLAHRVVESQRWR